MTARANKKTQVLAAAKADLSERTGRRLEKSRSLRPKKPHHWRTRPDPLLAVWESELVPKLQAAPELNATTLLGYLQNTYPGDYSDSVLRTLQRRVKEWKALQGPEKSVIFSQVHEPGLQGLSDFTHPTDIIITIKSKALKHLWYHFRLAMSGWSYLQVTLGGESYSALAEGLQNALWRLGGSPKEHRTDHLSACFNNLSKDSQRDVTLRYDALCAHYQMTPTRNNLGVCHENGSVEGPHGHLKRAIKQALLLRGNHDFESIEAYQAWLDEVVKNYNERHAKHLAHERDFLQPLPLVKTVDYTELMVRVKRTSSITVRCVTYTVPSRLCGERLRVHLYDNRLICYLGSKQAVTLTRVYPPKGPKRRARSINYRHVISSLVKKPQAFRHSCWRDDLLPTPTYHKIWDLLQQQLETKTACRVMVRLLALAARENCEGPLGEYVLARLEQGHHPKLDTLERRFGSPLIVAPPLTVIQHDLTAYDQLLGGQSHA